MANLQPAATSEDMADEAELLHELKRQNGYLAALHETALSLMNHHDVNELLQAIIERAVELVGAAQGYVSTVDASRNVLVSVAGAGAYPQRIGMERAPGEGATGRVWQTGESLVVNDYQSWPQRVGGPGLDEAHALMAVPLHAGNDITGVLAMVRYDAASPFTCEDVMLLERFAELASIALDNASLSAAARARQASLARFQALVEHTSDAIVAFDAQGIISYASPSTAGVLGYAPEELVGRSGIELLPAEERAIRAEGLKSLLLRPGGSTTAGYRFQRKDGSWRWLEAVTTNLLNEPTVGAVVSDIRDVTERKEAVEALADSEHRFRALVQNAAGMIAVVEPGGLIGYVSPGVERMLGFSPEELQGRPGSLWVHPDDLARLQESVRHCTGDGAQQVVEYRALHRDGSWRSIEAMVTVLYGDPSVRGTVVNAHDVTERKRIEAQLAYQAFHDPLTGLPNRALFLDRLGHALAGAGRRASEVAVLFLDLDRFKLVNDTLGHGVGDELLTAVGERLRHALRAGDTLARFGGDEFVALLST